MAEEKYKEYFNRTLVNGGVNSYNSIIHASYELRGNSIDTNFVYNGNQLDLSKSKKGDIVDIVGGYPWTIDTV